MLAIPVLPHIAGRRIANYPEPMLAVSIYPDSAAYTLAARYGMAPPSSAARNRDMALSTTTEDPTTPRRSLTKQSPKSLRYDPALSYRRQRLYMPNTPFVHRICTDVRDPYLDSFFDAKDPFEFLADFDSFFSEPHLSTDHLDGPEEAFLSAFFGDYHHFLQEIGLKNSSQRSVLKGCAILKALKAWTDKNCPGIPTRSNTRGAFVFSGHEIKECHDANLNPFSAETYEFSFSPGCMDNGNIVDFTILVKEHGEPVKVGQAYLDRLRIGDSGVYYNPQGWRSHVSWPNRWLGVSIGKREVSL